MNFPHLPEHAHPALRLMASEDWLSSYAEMEGIADVLARMSRRARQPNPLAGGEQELLDDIDGFGHDFADWLQDARRFISQWRATNC
jgi:acyl carrier protein phosphodiesterase